MVAGQYPGVRQYSANRGVGCSTASFENSKRRIVTTPMYCRIRNTPWFHPYCARLGRGYTYPEIFSAPASSIIHYYDPYAMLGILGLRPRTNTKRHLRRGFLHGCRGRGYWMGSACDYPDAK